MTIVHIKNNAFKQLNRFTNSAPPPSRNPPLCPPPTSAPMSAPPAATPPDNQNLSPLVLGDNEALERMLGLVRDVRAEAQNLEKSLAEIDASCKIADKTIRTTALKSSITHNLKIFSYNQQQIENRISELRQLINDKSFLYDQYGDEVVIIENLWQRVTMAWPNSPNEDPNDIAARLPKLNQDIGDLVFQAGYFTIPPRLCQHLEQLRPGRSLDFHGTFADELPKREDRLKILDLLHTHPLSVECGVVDAENGVVYRASPKQWRRWASFGLIMSAFLFGALVVFLLANLGSLLNLQDWPVNSGRFMELLVGYVFITIGGMAHIGIDVLKQARSNKGKSFLAIEDLVLWVHVKELSIVSGVGSLIVGILGLALFTPAVQWTMAFFVGYSIDSFVDFFLQRFSKTVATNTDTLKQKLS